MFRVTVFIHLKERNKFVPPPPPLPPLRGKPPNEYKGQADDVKEFDENEADLTDEDSKEYERNENDAEEFDETEAELTG